MWLIFTAQISRVSSSKSLLAAVKLPRNTLFKDIPLLCSVCQAGEATRSSPFIMSQATKRKHVVQELLGDFVTPTENQQIVKVTGSRGNNLHEAVTAQGVTFLVSMPTKFRKNIWIKRGDYVIVDPIEEGEKVKAEISFILYKDQIQHLQKQQLWPEGFTEEPSEQDKTGKQQEKEGETEERDEEFSDSEDDESDLFVNTNRCNYQYSESEEEDSEEEDDDDKEGRTENGS